MKKKNKNKISEHAPKAKQPIIKNEFGSFLAGLIDGNGHISKQGYALIVFHEKDLSVAYYLKKVLNYGYVRKVKNKRAYDFKCTNPQGLEKIEALVFSKLKLPTRIKQFNSYLVPKISCESLPCSPCLLKIKGQTKPVADCLFKNHWLAGFIQAKGRFQIKMLQRFFSNPRIFVEIDQKDHFLLRQIERAFGGNIAYNKAQNTYNYSSVHLNNVVHYIDYLDCYQVMGATLTVYWLWRKAYLIVQDSQYNAQAGVHKLARLKQSLTILRN